MRTAVWIVVWVVCVLLGAFVGYLAGYGLWKLGFEIIGSAVALVGAGVGGILVFLALLSWWDRRSTARA
jgi:hypothetical protein